MSRRNGLLILVLGVSILCLYASSQIIKGQEGTSHERPTHIKLINGEEVDITKMTWKPPERQVVADLSTKDAFSFKPTSKNPGKPGMGVIKYKLLEPAKIRIRIVNKKIPHLIYRELVRWELRDTGEHTEKWDGKDASGYPVLRKDVMIRFRYEPEDMTIPSYDAKIILNDPNHRWGHIHKLHQKDKCGAFKLEWVGPTKDDVTTELVAIGGERALVINPDDTPELLFEVKLKGDFKGYSEKWGFGVHWWLDDKKELKDEDIKSEDAKKYYNNPNGGETFKLTLDTTSLKEGMHIITASLCDHNDHGAIARLVVHIDRKARKP